MHPTESTVLLDASKYSIKSVTIFQSSTAEVTRAFVISLQSGRNSVEISNIPSGIDMESPRIHGLGNAARVFDVCCTKVTQSNTSSNYSRSSSTVPITKSKNSQTIAELSEKKKELKMEHALCQQEYDALQDSMRSLLGKQDADHLDDLLERIIQRQRAARKAMFDIDDQISKIDEEIVLLGKHRGETSAIVTVTIIAERACEVKFQLTYLVSGASWKPYYDLRATTSEGKPSSEILLSYCANITQTTGEDWEDAALTLSTANSQTLESLSVPTVETLKISATSLAPVPPRRRSPSPDRTRRYRRHPASISPESIVIEPHILSQSAPQAVPALPPQQADVDRGNPLSLAFHIGDAVSLPSDGLAHKVSIAMLDFSAELNYVCIPRQTETAFIEATIKNTSEYELLAGPVSVFMDDGFVTKTSLGLISVNESFKCTLGVDTALKVTFRQHSRTEQEPQRNFAEPIKTTTRTVTTTVTNNHSFNISPLLVRDAIPLGDDDGKVKVTLCKPEGLARAKDDEEVSVEAGGDATDAKIRWTKIVNGRGGEKDGMYEWVCGIPAGKKIELEAVWDVKAPANVQWEEKVNKSGEAKK